MPSSSTMEQLLCSLTEETPYVEAFKGKWAVIGAKLARLPTQLTQLAESPNSESQLASELVEAVSQTLSDALSLARKCRNPNLVDGKLRTQSDIDAVTAKLHQHISDLDLLARTGALEESSGSVSSRREWVRVEARNLMTRLQIGSAESRNSAMESLLRLLNEDDKNVLIVVAQGVVPILTRLLDSACPEMKAKAVSAISRVSVVDSCKHVLIAEGLQLINQLIRVLESRSGFAKEKACIALQALSFSKENARAIGCRGGIGALLEICEAGTPCSQAYAAGVLRNLAGTFVAQENAIGCLCNLVSEDQSMRLLVAREGGVECLKTFWDSAPSVYSLEVAVGLLKNLASCRTVAEAIVSEDFIGKLKGVLSCGAVGVRIAAAGAVHELGFSSRTRKEMGEAGFIPHLVMMLEAKAVEEKEMAAKALSSLMLYSGNRRIFTKQEKGIECAVQLLDPLQNLDKKYAISVLASIGNSKKCRKQIIAAGACAYLQKLIEMEIDGAKKLYESLDGNSNIWGLFGRTK
ncbi:U-box domain-containing protein 4 [Vitis vinifera]|uniref:U-box domain-containing protein 4 n=1 Tax=Vitis vinifera TaxID=29760 RepID=A0A438HHT3_VITVI|nr:U-box domain-containing protein 4 [Vitis vinifera]